MTVEELVDAATKNILEVAANEGRLDLVVQTNNRLLLAIACALTAHAKASSKERLDLRQQMKWQHEDWALRQDVLLDALGKKETEEDA